MSFVSLLDKLDVSDGDLIFLHTSYARMKAFNLSPEALLKAVMNRLGSQGTLVLPAYAWNIDPTARPWKGYADYFNNRPLFDTRLTPTNLGCVPEIFRNFDGVTRSDSYWWSVCATGPLAYEITRNQAEIKEYYGPDSTFGRLARLGVKILGLGVTLNTTSLALVADYELGPRHWPCVFTTAPQIGKIFCKDGRELNTEAYWLLPEVVRYIKPERVFAKSSVLRSVLCRYDDGDTIYFCYPYAAYHETALSLGREAMSNGLLPPWLEKLPRAGRDV